MITVTKVDDDSIFPLDCSPSITLADLQALLEADTSIPASDQALFFNGNHLSDSSKSLHDYGVADGDLLVLRARSTATTAAATAGGASASTSHQQQQPSEEALTEQLRQQVLADANLMAQLRQSNPPLAEAARNSPSDFARLMAEYRSHMASVQRQRMQAEADLASADEFDIDAQRRIEEAIQQENVLANLEHAMEYNPESFGRVNMLYVMTEINGVEVKAFVDSGAQATIMSPDCAERCGIMRLLDRRFAGIAKGVGTAKILGRIHSAQIKLSDKLFLPCSFTVMEGKGVECLFGLDMLKRYQASIDLKTNALIINDERCRFLDEHELPSSAKELESGEDAEAEAEAASRSKADAATSGGAGGQDVAQGSGGAGAGAGFPGAGNTLASSSSAGAGSGQGPLPAAPSSSSSSAAPPASAPSGARATLPEESIKALQGLGASEAQARALLEAAGGNVEVAAGLLFQGQ